MNKDDLIFVAGHQGLVGSAIVRNLELRGFSNLLTRPREELDLTNQSAVSGFFETECPRYVFLAAARVGGIHANSNYPADFIRDNLQVQTNVIDAAWHSGVKRLLFLGSSCVYPKAADQPIKEEYLLTGPLEETNEPYAVAKIAGIKLCESYNRQYGTQYRSVMPTNLYGPNDNFHLENSHVVPAMIRKFHQAKLDNSPSVEVWGTGAPKREFLHVDDMASACLHIMELDEDIYRASTKPALSHINIGSGIDITVKEVAETVKKVVGCQSKILFNSNKPDGAPRKLLNVTKLNKLGWNAQITFEQGLADTYQWFLDHQKTFRS